MAVLGLHLCARALSSCGKRGPLFIVVRGPLIIAASPVAEHRLQTRRLSSCGSRAQLLRSMWDPPRPGLEPVSPALAGRLSTTAPPGKPSSLLWLCNLKGNTPGPPYFPLFCIIFWHDVCLCLCPSSRMEVLWEQEIWTALFSTVVSTPSRGTGAWYAISQHVSTSRKKWRPAHT